MKDKSLLMLKVILYTLVAIFVVLVSYIAIPGLSSVKGAIFPIIALLGIAFCLLGLVTTVPLTYKSSVVR